MKTGDRQMAPGVDLDGVCADFCGRMREIAAEWFERDAEGPTADVSDPLKERGKDESWTNQDRKAA